MRTFADTSLPVAVGIGVGVLCAAHGYDLFQTLAFVTGFYALWAFASREVVG